MERRPLKLTGRLARLAVLPALALGVPSQAQMPGSVQEYRLPSAPSPTPTAAGPVDNDHPVAAPTTPAPEPTSTPRPVIALPSPATAPAPPPSAAPSPRATPSLRSQAQPAPAADAATTAPTPQPTEPPPVSSTGLLEPGPVPAPSASAMPTPAVVSAEKNSHWLWLAGAAVLVLLLGAILRRWRRGRRRDAIEYEPGEYEPGEYEPAIAKPDEPQPEPSPPASLTPPRHAPPPPAAQPPAVQPQPIEMQLEARHLSRALVNATLAYRLTLTNRSSAATGPLRIAGDIVSAHASLSAQEQLAPGDAALEKIHELPDLAPGESVTLSGELRMPIASILPIQSGARRVFVPLARFRTEIPGTAMTRVFVIGQASEQPGGALRPFPLDRGPGVDRGLGQRELEMPV